jgi:hypothetical protein
MTWFADLSSCTYFGVEFAPRLRAVGWLEPGNAYTTGDVAEETFERLCCLLADPWTFFASSGGHGCGFCRFTGGVGTSTYRGHRVCGYSAHVLFVPGEGILYVAPAGIRHYIDAHGYQPPDEFCRAVQACPDMRTMAYKRAVLENGGRGLARVGGA